MSVKRDLETEAAAAAVLVANMRDVLADDEQAERDAIEGETGLFEALSAAGERILEIEAFETAIDGRIAALRTRKDRYARQGESLRSAVQSAMAMAGLKTSEFEHVTLTRKALGASVEVVEEADIPSQFFKMPPPPAPKLDRMGLLKALKDCRDGESIPGARLVTGRETVQIKAI